MQRGRTQNTVFYDTATTITKKVLIFHAPDCLTDKIVAVEKIKNIERCE